MGVAGAAGAAAHAVSTISESDNEIRMAHDAKIRR